MRLLLPGPVAFLGFKRIYTMFSTSYPRCLAFFPRISPISPTSQLVRSLVLLFSLVSTQTLQPYDTMT